MKRDRLYLHNIMLTCVLLWKGELYYYIKLANEGIDLISVAHALHPSIHSVLCSFNGVCM